MDSDRCIPFQLAKANQLAGKFLGQKVANLNITPVQALAPGFLNGEDQIAASELERKTELDSATLTGILDRLEAAQLIERHSNPGDRRPILTHLAESGKVVAIEAARLIGEANQAPRSRPTRPIDSTAGACRAPRSAPPCTAW